ncbi:hypothetical protein DMENIID0001_169890 [Sergentomyia squamirostris]
MDLDEEIPPIFDEEEREQLRQDLKKRMQEKLEQKRAEQEAHDYNENVYEDEISQEVHPNGVIHPEERENGEVKEEEEYHVEENSQDVPELPPPAPVTPAPTTAPPPQTTTAFDPNCGPDRGGCDHECRRVLSDHGESHTECSCFTGYELNVRDGRTCNDSLRRCDGQLSACSYIGQEHRDENFPKLMKELWIGTTETSTTSA